jgi:hypothetical protein
MSTPVKTKKKSIPKVVKDLSWNKWVGDDVAKTKCMCCEVNEIKMSSFHCGHIVAEANGGKATVDNLKPICAACNLSMGTENLEDFKKRCGFADISAKKVAPKEPSPREKKIQRLLNLGYIHLVPGNMINRDQCKHCSKYFHNPFKNVMCPCQMCDSCNELQNRELYSPCGGIVCRH